MFFSDHFHQDLHAKELSFKADRTPLPRIQLGLLLLCRLVEPIAFTCVFPFINESVSRFVEPAKAGYISGCIESAFALAQALTVYGWGYLSDSIGRKPIILVGLLGVSISTCLFGLSNTVFTMIVTRCLSGLLNGNTAVVRTAIGEITDHTNEAIAFGAFGAAWPLGVALGPYLSGLLVNPVKRFPGLFGTSEFLRRYPYLLSCLANSSFSWIAFLVGLFFLKETLQKTRTDDQVDESTSLLKKTKPQHSIRSLLTSHTKPVLLHNGVLAFVSTAIEALLPLILFEPTHLGGLGLDAHDIGKTLSARAIMSVLSQLTCFPPIQRRFGNVITARVFTVFLFIPIYYFLVAFALLTLSISQTVWTANYLLLSHASPSRDALGSLNGLAQMLSCTARAAAPAAASAIFALSVSSNILGGNLIWLLLTFFCFLAVCTSFLLKESAEVDLAN